MQVAIDLYGTNEGEEDADVDKFEGDLDEFYIADAFGSRARGARWRRLGLRVKREEGNALFVQKKGQVV